MLKLLRVGLLASTALLYPSQAARAWFVLPFLGGILASFGVVTPLIGIGGIGVVNAGFALGTFLSSGLGSLLLSVGISALSYVVSKPDAPKQDAARVNVRVSEPERWIIIGRARSGGSVLFAEYGEKGDFWYIVVHGDSRFVGAPIATLLDNIPVTIDTTDGKNLVTNEEFFENIFSVWTRTYTADDPVPPPLAKFKEIFPAWTDDHLLVGTTYSIVRCEGVGAEDRAKMMTWRGPIGLGEPSVSIVADWDVCYDPRDETQDIDDQSTWLPSRNLELVWARFRTHPLGRNKPMSSIAWDKVAEQADICDQTMLDKNGNPHMRYGCGIAVPDSKERGVGEQEIMLAGDGVILRDDQGKAYLKVGAWEEPTLTLTRKRDILAMSSRVAQDGEMMTDGVVVRYTEPEFGWITQPCAAWKNPRYFEEGRAPRYLQVDALACHDHNQAVRLAKSIGETSQAPYRLAPTTGLRGLRAAQERIIDLDYDASWQGPHKIATTVELDESGIACGFGIVPIDENHWTLLEGEEGDKPAPVVDIVYDSDLPLPTGVVLSAVSVPAAGAYGVRLEATFDDPERADRRYEFQYQKDGEIIWRPMAVLMTDFLAYSDTIADQALYKVRYRTVTLSGRASPWKSPPLEINAVADTVPPSPVVSVNVSVTDGVATVTIVAPNNPSDKLRSVRVFRAPAADTYPTNAVDVSGQRNVAPYETISFVDDQRFAPSASYRWHVVAENHSGVPSDPVSSGAYTAGPGALTSVSVTGWTSVASNVGLGHVNFGYTAPGSAAIASVRRYRCNTGATLNKVTHLIDDVATDPGEVVSSHFGDNTRTSLIVNGDFASGSGWSLGSGWSVSAGKLNFSGATATTALRTVSALAAGAIRHVYTVSSYSAGDVRLRITSSTVDGSVRTANGTYGGSVTSTGTQTQIGFRAAASSSFSIDEFAAYEVTVTCISQGIHDYYFEPVDIHGNVGPLSGPHTATTV